MYFELGGERRTVKVVMVKRRLRQTDEMEEEIDSKYNGDGQCHDRLKDHKSFISI